MRVYDFLMYFIYSNILFIDSKLYRTRLRKCEKLCTEQRFSFHRRANNQKCNGTTCTDSFQVVDRGRCGESQSWWCHQEPDFSVGQCGTRLLKKTRKRVVGGFPANAHNWPWMVAIVNSVGKVDCGGVLLSNTHVLSAAHCFKYNDHYVEVRVGQHKFWPKTFEDIQKRNSLKVHVHPNYSAETHANDFAIIELSERIVFSRFANPACLPARDQSFGTEKSFCYLSGWGNTEVIRGELLSKFRFGVHLTSFGMSDQFKIPQPEELQERRMYILNESVCSDVYKEFFVNESMFCAGIMEGGSDACVGDSGSPLACKDANGLWYVVGIVSFGIGCAMKGVPSVYASIGSALEWINTFI